MKQLSFPTTNTGTRRSTGTRLWSLLALLVLASIHSAQAHPGHSLGDHGFGHVASSPYHVSILAGSGLALCLGARFIKTPIARRLLQAGGIAAVLFAGVWWGVCL